MKLGWLEPLFKEDDYQAPEGTPLGPGNVVRQEQVVWKQECLPPQLSCCRRILAHIPSLLHDLMYPEPANDMELLFPQLSRLCSGTV